MIDEPCKKCGMLDRYVKGNFSYCRPCHNEAQKRYLENKRLGIAVSKQGPPNKPLDQLLRQKSMPLKKYCPRGHSYSGANVRLETQVTGNLQRRCRTCERDAKRVQYGLLPSADPVRLTDLLDSES